MLFAGDFNNTEGSRGTPASHLLSSQVALQLQGVNRLQCIAHAAVCGSGFEQTASSCVILQTAKSSALLRLQESSALLSFAFYFLILFFNYSSFCLSGGYHRTRHLPGGDGSTPTSRFGGERGASHQGGSHRLALEGLCAALQPAGVQTHRLQPVLSVTSPNTHWFCKRKI